MERHGHREISQLLRKIEDVCFVKEEHVINQVGVKANAQQEVCIYFCLKKNWLHYRSSLCRVILVEMSQ